MIKIAESYASIVKNANILIKSQNNEKKSTEQLTASQKESLRLQKQLETTKAKNAQLTSKTSKELIKQQVVLQKNTKALRDQAKAAQGIKKTNGLFKSLTKSILANAAAFLSFRLAATFIKNIINTVKNYEAALSSLRAITGATTKDMIFYGVAAVKTARRTQQSATDIVKAYEKVGSASPILLKNARALATVTENAIILSEATGGKLQLEDAVEGLTAVMNQFDIPASRAREIINALAAGSLEGSAGVLEMTESLKASGTVAKSSNLTYQQTIGVLELFATKQLKGAEAGTALRGTLLRLRKAQLGYTSGQFNLNDAIDEANKKLSEMGSNLERDAFLSKIFGDRNIIAGQILLDNKDKYNELTEAVTGTNTALEQQSIQNDNLVGDIGAMESAWESLVIAFNEGTLSISNNLRAIAQGITKILNTVSDDAILEKFGLDRKLFQDTEKVGRNFLKLYRDLETGTDNLIQSASDIDDFEKAIAEMTKTQSFFTEQTDIEQAKFKLYAQNIEKLEQAKQTFLENLAIQETARLKKEEKERQLALAKKLADEKAAAIAGQRAANNATENINKKTIESVGIGIEGATELTITQESLLDRQRITQEEYDAWFLQSQKDKWATAQNLVSMFSGFAIDSINGIFQFQLKSIDNELDALDFRYQSSRDRLISNGESTIQLETEFNLRRLALEDERAKREKQAAIVNIGLTYAQTAFEIIATAAALSSNPLTIALSPIAWAQLGALTVAQGVQLAAVSQFDKGTGSTPGVYIGGEGDGSELRRDAKTGNWSLLTDATLFTDNPGDTIISTKETESILSGASMKATTGNAQIDTAAIVNAINNIPPPPHMNSKGYEVIIDRRGNTKKYLDKRIRN
jgi:TP901 family phage tail tape measure protein